MNLRHDMIAAYVLKNRAAGGHQLLQLRRAAGDTLGGTWQTVRGRSHPGEPAWRAALRELREETGLIPGEFYKLSTLEVFYLASEEAICHCPAFCAVVAERDSVRLNEEHDQFRWIDLENAQEQFMWPVERQAIEEIRREIIGDGLSKPWLRLEI